MKFFNRRNRFRFSFASRRGINISCGLHRRLRRFPAQSDTEQPPPPRQDRLNRTGLSQNSSSSCAAMCFNDSGSSATRAPSSSRYATIRSPRFEIPVPGSAAKKIPPGGSAFHPGCRIQHIEKFQTAQRLPDTDRADLRRIQFQAPPPTAGDPPRRAYPQLCATKNTVHHHFRLVPPRGYKKISPVYIIQYSTIDYKKSFNDLNINRKT